MSWHQWFEIQAKSAEVGAILALVVIAVAALISWGGKNI